MIKNYVKKNIKFFIFIIMCTASIYYLQKTGNKELKKKIEKESKIDELENENYNDPETLSEDDFIIMNDTTFIALDEEYEKIKTSEDIIYVRHINEVHVYDTYVYETFLINVVPRDNGIISKIKINEPELKTYRGISIGDTISDVLIKYGQPHSKSQNTYIYHVESKLLLFEYDNNYKIIEICFDII